MEEISKEKPTGKYLIACTFGCKVPDFLFKNADNGLYYDASGEEVPLDAIDEWKDVTDIMKSLYHE